MEENKLYACKERFANVFQNVLLISHSPLPPQTKYKTMWCGKIYKHVDMYDLSIHTWICIWMCIIYRYECVLYIGLYI